MLLSLGELHAHGFPLDWAEVLPDGEAIELPTYAFQRDRYWLDPPRTGRAIVDERRTAPPDLPPVPVRLTPRPPVDTAYAAPAGDLERLLADVWRQVLGIEEIGVHDNFFELGGTSLQAGQVLTRLTTSFPVEIRFDLFFGNPTIAELARLVEEHLVAHLAELTDDEAEQLLARMNPDT
jgi:acyl transferase domain-containing protein